MILYAYVEASYQIILRIILLKLINTFDKLNYYFIFSKNKSLVKLSTETIKWIAITCWVFLPFCISRK